MSFHSPCTDHDLIMTLQAYSFDPLNGISSDQAHLVLGGQQLLWTEQSGPENLDPVVWPRAAASAEVFWTGKTLPDGTAANVQNALPRLHDIRYANFVIRYGENVADRLDAGTVWSREV